MAQKKMTAQIKGICADGIGMANSYAEKRNSAAAKRVFPERISRLRKAAETNTA